MNLRGDRSRDEPEINFIPLIDVMLVILIFLMVTTTYQRVTELQITLPQADAATARQQPREIEVGLDAQGRYSIAGGPPFVFTTPEAMTAMLRSAAGSEREPVIVINADARASHQSVVRVMEAARDAGYTHITFATQAAASPAR
ncbi:MAG: biopolymer transporter ExbD [Proteobacteria bacterium]|jgi:biopolymer transport protein ExbD|nr:biopolymer transporter ExbD [Pseudomonadota bacterium]